MICFALAKGDSVKALELFWETPLKDIWMLLWCYYKYNDVKVKRLIDEDMEAIIG